MNFKDEVKQMLVLKEMGFEIGTKKDGTYGYRSVENGNMIDKTPPQNKNFIDMVMKILEGRKELGKLKDFDLTTVDVVSTSAGGAIINFEDGTKEKITPEEISSFAIRTKS